MRFQQIRRCVFIALGIAISGFPFGCKPSTNQPTDTASSKAGEIHVFYPKHWEDSIQDIFANTSFLADSNLIRFEENRKETDPQYYESMYDFELHSSDQLNDEDPKTSKPFNTYGLTWIIDPSSDYYNQSQFQPTKEIPSLKDTLIDGVYCTWLQNVWAKEQVVLCLHDSHSAGENLTAAWIKKHQAYLCSQTKSFELNIAASSSPRHHPALEQNTYSDSISLLIEGKYNIKPCISAELKLVQATNDFIWLRHENSQYHSNVMVNIYPFSDSTYSHSMAVKWRNQSTKKYLKTAEGTWVEVSESGQFPIRFFTANGSDDGSEFMMNGWYTELNTDRRGPFIRRIIKDSVNQRIIAIDGFLFAPNQPRLHLMRELEIMVNLFAVKS
jgi:hypothetical protein